MREKSARRSLCSDCSSLRSTSTEGEHRSHRFASSAFSPPVSSPTPSLWLVFRSRPLFFVRPRLRPPHRPRTFIQNGHPASCPTCPTCPTARFSPLRNSYASRASSPSTRPDASRQIMLSLCAGSMSFTVQPMMAAPVTARAAVPFMQAIDDEGNSGAAACPHTSAWHALSHHRKRSSRV